MMDHMGSVPSPPVEARVEQVLRELPPGLRSYHASPDIVRGTMTGLPRDSLAGRVTLRRRRVTLFSALRLGLYAQEISLRLPRAVTALTVLERAKKAFLKRTHAPGGAIYEKTAARNQHLFRGATTEEGCASAVPV